MALFKYDIYASKTAGNVFDELYIPFMAAPRAGIYRCLGCGRETVCKEGDALPVHPHEHGMKRKRWRLIVYADHRPK
jgi:hypothetical protein